VKITLQIVLLQFFLCYALLGKSQSDSISKHLPTKTNLIEHVWAPATLGILSVTLMTDSSKYGLQTLIQQPFNGFKTDLDDYIQYAPIVMMYTADLFHLKSKNTVWNQTKFLAMSELGTAAIVQILKYTLRIERPDHTKFNSYPSGHSAQAFVASQVLFNEYRETNKLLAYSGFLFSISTGTLRIVNNRHWVPDVLMGAGIAVLVTNLIYHYEPLKKWNPFSKKNRKIETGFFPTLREDYIGGYLTLKF
jgi:hypothetical protein